MMSDDDDHNDEKVPVTGNVKRILGIRTSLSCYGQKTTKRSRNNLGKTVPTVLYFNVTIRVNSFLLKQHVTLVRSLTFNSDLILNLWSNTHFFHKYDMLQHKHTATRFDTKSKFSLER